MRASILPLAAAFAALAPGAALAQAVFLSAAEDVPLPPGFQEAVAPAAFAAPRGRILEMQATGPGDPQAVRQFYREAMPHLGWTSPPGLPGEALVFVRGRERLSLTISPADARGGVTVSFLLIVQPASAALD